MDPAGQIRTVPGRGRGYFASGGSGVPLYPQ
jgi:hypothetical protein